MEDHCSECGYDGRLLTLGEVADRLDAVPTLVRAVRAGAGGDTLRRRPPGGGWSAIEYIGHLRDLMAFHRWLIERAIAEDEPVVEPVDPDAAVAAAGYADSNPDDLIGQFDRRVERLVNVVRGLDESSARRRLTVDVATGPIDVGVVARSALHESHHHVLDLRRLVPPS